MRILLDECVHPWLKRLLPQHLVVTVAECGWLGISDSELLTQARAVADVF